MKKSRSAHRLSQPGAGLGWREPAWPAIETKAPLTTAAPLWVPNGASDRVFLPTAALEPLVLFVEPAISDAPFCFENRHEVDLRRWHHVGGRAQPSHEGGNKMRWCRGPCVRCRERNLLAETKRLCPGCNKLALCTNINNNTRNTVPKSQARTAPRWRQGMRLSRAAPRESLETCSFVHCVCS